MKSFMSILYTLSLLSMSMGENRYLRRNLQDLDLTKSECLKRGPSLHCFPSNNCDQGWKCVPAKDVNPSEWVGTFCYDPACLPTNRVDNNNQTSLDIVLPDGFLPEDACWADRCGKNTGCADGLSCMTKGIASCYCRDPAVYKKDCSKIVGTFTDTLDTPCEYDFTDDVWAMSPVTDPPTASPTKSRSKSAKDHTRKLGRSRSAQLPQ